MAGALIYAPHPLDCPLLWPLVEAASKPVVGTVEELDDHAKAAAVTAVGAAATHMLTPPLGATLVL